MIITEKFETCQITGEFNLSPNKCLISTTDPVLDDLLSDFRESGLFGLHLQVTLQQPITNTKQFYYLVGYFLGKLIHMTILPKFRKIGWGTIPLLDSRMLVHATLDLTVPQSSSFCLTKRFDELEPCDVAKCFQDDFANYEKYLEIENFFRGIVNGLQAALILYITNITTDLPVLSTQMVQALALALNYALSAREYELASAPKCIEDKKHVWRVVEKPRDNNSGYHRDQCDICGMIVHYDTSD